MTEDRMKAKKTPSLPESKIVKRHDGELIDGRRWQISQIEMEREDDKVVVKATKLSDQKNNKIGRLKTFVEEREEGDNQNKISNYLTKK